MHDAVARAAEALAKQGAKVETIKAPVDTRELMVNYIWLLNSIIGAGLSEAVLTGNGEDARDRPESLRRLARSVGHRTLTPRRHRAASEVLAATRAPGAGKIDGDVLQYTMRSSCRSRP